MALPSSDFYTKYADYQDRIRRRERLCFLGPLLSLVFAFMIMGFNIKVPLTLFLYHRPRAILFSLVVCLVNYWYNRREIQKDKQALAEYKESHIEPTRLSMGTYYQRTQLFSFLIIFLIFFGMRVILKPHEYTGDEIKALSLSLAGLEELDEAPGKVTLSGYQGMVAPHQYGLQVSFGKTDQDKYLSLDLYQMKTPDLARGLYLQMDRQVTAPPVSEAEAELLHPYALYESTDVPDDVLVKYLAQDNPERNLPVYYALLYRGDTVLAARYQGLASADELIQYLLRFLPSEG